MECRYRQCIRCIIKAEQERPALLHEDVTGYAPRSGDERAQRTRFGAICKAVALRRKDLAHVAEDLAAFNAQKDTAGGYKTMRQYLWHVCAAEYNG